MIFHVEMLLLTKVYNFLQQSHKIINVKQIYTYAVFSMIQTVLFDPSLNTHIFKPPI